ncbi:hypothetical protein IT399_03315 [Candidatus Nomurabacteria bacterium]|nr:hypothetical protein [Candidatus Nomurabacteria bacterium]
MNLEGPNKNLSSNRTIEFLGKEYKVIDVPLLTPDLIEQGDRVFFSTESGNRYMIRRSRSHNGDLKIYNEKQDGFSTGELIHDQRAKKVLAEVGKPMELWIVTDEVKNLGVKINSTNVKSIEIRKAIDDIANLTPDELKGKNLSDMLLDQIHGRKR